LETGAATVKARASVARNGAEGSTFGATAFENGPEVFGVGAVVVNIGATADGLGQSSRRIRQRRKEAGTGQKDCACVCAFGETTDCHRFPHGL
jgi:hypothetical protein